MNQLRRAVLKPYHFARGIAAAVFYGFPARRLTVVGVTGTDGKTTTAHLIYEILKKADRKVALVSTVAAFAGGEAIDTGFHVTSPDPFSLQSFLKKIVTQGTTHLVLEVTSHGLDQFRVWGIDFKVAVVTNITHEHLDYHQTFADYRAAKAKILSRTDYAVLNYDDPSFGYLKSKIKPDVRLVIFSNRPVPVAEKSYLNVNARAVRQTDSGLNFIAGFDAQSLEIKSTLMGEYNLENVLAAVGVAKVLGLDDQAIVSGVATFRGVSGRLEEVDEGQPFKVVVDFAHTPNALARVLELSSKFNPPAGGQNSRLRQGSGGQAKLIVVFGCAGLRDKGKRALMGEIAGRLAEVAILTAEDPRTENVNDIINDISDGCLRVGAVESSLVVPQTLRQLIEQNNSVHVFVRVPDRRQAIKLALTVAGSGDVVLLTGKGHEKSMCYGTTEFPWSDQAVVREELSQLLP